VFQDEGEIAEQQSSEDEEGASDEQRQFRLQRKQQRLKQVCRLLVYP
jgi:hypothetical protein